MPPKKRLLLPEPEEIQSQAEMDVDQFLEEIGPGETVVEVVRMRDDGRRPQCGTVTLDLFREDPYSYLRNAYGAGRYLIRFKNEKRQYLPNSRVFEVEASKEIAPVQSHSNGNGGGTADLMFQMMQTQMQFQQSMILSMINGQNGQKPMDLTPFIQMMKPPDMLQMLALAKEIFKGPEEQKSSMKETLEVIEMAKGLVSDSGSSSGGPDMMTMATTLGGKLLDVVSNAQRKAVIVEAQPIHNPVPALPEAPKPETETLTVSPKQPAQSSDEIMQQWLVTQLTYLKAKAKAGKDPEAWGEYVLDNQEEPGCAAILQALDRGATLDNLLQFDPEIANDPILKAWFSKLYDFLQPELPSDVDTSGDSGDVGDVTADAKNGVGTEPPGKRSGKSSKKSV